MIRGDPNRTWTQIASKMLDPGDLVLTRDQQHDYLLHQRFNLRTINLRAPHDLDEADRADWWEDSKAIVRSQGRAGGRVLVDWKVSDPPSGSRTYAFQNELHELVLLAPVRHLDPRGEERDPPESLNVPGENESLWPEKIPSNVH